MSRDALLHDCVVHIPGLFPWAIWCCSSPHILWHPLGCLMSELGVQQGTTPCLNILFQAWYLDDGVLAGKKSSVLRALTLIQEIGHTLGLRVNIAKC